MLVLTRRAGEKLVIEEEIEIEVLAIKKGSIRIGIKAPEEIILQRAEIYEKDEELAEE